MDEKERRYQLACKLLNITEGKPINRKPRKPARGFKILKGLENYGWELDPEELIAFQEYFSRINEAKSLYDEAKLSPPSSVQGWHNTLVNWRYSEDYLKFTTANLTIEEIPQIPLSSGTIETVLSLLSQGMKSGTPEERQGYIQQIQEVLANADSGD